MGTYKDIKEAVREYIENTDEMERFGRLARANKAYTSFVNDFPKEQIESLKLEDYLISKKGGEGSEKSFCYRIRYEIDAMGHMGNIYYNVFGIYLNDGTELTLSKGLEKKFGNDFDGAFSYIKEQIQALFDAFEHILSQ